MAKTPVNPRLLTSYLVLSWLMLLSGVVEVATGAYALASGAVDSSPTITLIAGFLSIIAGFGGMGVVAYMRKTSGTERRDAE